MRGSKRANAKRRDRPPFSLVNPPVAYTLSINETARLDGSSRKTVYRKVAAGTYDAIRHGRHIRILTQPLLELLAGKRRLARPLTDRPGGARKKRRNKAKPNPATKRKVQRSGSRTLKLANKGEAARPAATTP